MKTTMRILSFIAVGGLLALAWGAFPVQAQSGGSTQGGGTGYFYTYLPFIVRDYRPYGGVITPNDPFFNNLDDTWAYNNTGVFGNTPDADIDAPEAWGYTTGSSSIIVAIVDSGIDTTHPEFSGRLLPGKHFYHLNSISYEDTNVTDGNGHGTHVAGIAAAAGNNGIGGVGVAWQVRILPVRVLDADGTGYMSDAARGVDYAVSQGAKVINLSMGGITSSTLLKTSIQNAKNAGVLVVTAAGNCGDTNYKANGCDYQNQTFYPAADSASIAVAATTPNDMRASFSNYGDYIDIAAPGVNILSTYPYALDNYAPEGYEWESGTSMAAPFVSGAAALIYSYFPGTTADQAAALLLQNTDDKGLSGWDTSFGCGRLNLFKIFNQAATSGNCSRPSPLSVSSQTVVQSETAPAAGEYRPGVVIVKFRTDAGVQSAEAALAQEGLSAVEHLDDLGVDVVAAPEGGEWNVVQRLRANPAVEWAELDAVIHALD